MQLIKDRSLFISNINQPTVSFHDVKAFERQSSTEDYHRLCHVKQVGLISGFISVKRGNHDRRTI